MTSLVNNNYELIFSFSQPNITDLTPKGDKTALLAMDINFNIFNNELELLEHMIISANGQGNKYRKLKELWFWETSFLDQVSLAAKKYPIFLTYEAAVSDITKNIFNELSVVLTKHPNQVDQSY
ncbi:MAG: hypothetical protein LWW97_10190 [Deltaproteobacteria bacterium]|nr:hypothetical protein [Deltaproteobacteria bacterium]